MICNKGNVERRLVSEDDDVLNAVCWSQKARTNEDAKRGYIHTCAMDCRARELAYHEELIGGAQIGQV